MDVALRKFALLLMLMASFSISAQKLSIIGVDVLDKITQREPTLIDAGLYSLPDTTFIGNMGSGHNSAYELRSLDVIWKAHLSASRYLLMAGSMFSPRMPRSSIVPSGPNSIRCGIDLME